MYTFLFIGVITLLGFLGAIVTAIYSWKKDKKNSIGAIITAILLLIISSICIIIPTSNCVEIIDNKVYIIDYD